MVLESVKTKGFRDVRGGAAAPAHNALSAFRYVERAFQAGATIFRCWTSPDPGFARRSEVRPEIFTAMIILEQLKESILSRSLTQEILALLERKRTEAGLHHFFIEEELLPADADCTSIAHSLLLAHNRLTPEDARASAERILGNTDRRGILAVYFTDAPERRDLVDPVVCANALYFLSQLRLDGHAEPTKRYLLEVLEERTFEAGTRYYPLPEAFLYFAARLVSAFRDRFQEHFRLLQRRVARRIGAEAGPLGLAFRLLASDLLGVPNPEDAETLTQLQRSDGAWSADAFFRCGRSPHYFGSESVTTAFCLRALRWGECESGARWPFQPGGSAGEGGVLARSTIMAAS